MSALGASSKLIAEWDIQRKLRDLGRRAAEDFLSANARDIGQRSSYDLDMLLKGI
jgi:NTE family protein